MRKPAQSGATVWVTGSMPAAHAPCFPDSRSRARHKPFHLSAEPVGGVRNTMMQVRANPTKIFVLVLVLVLDLPASDYEDEDDDEDEVVAASPRCEPRPPTVRLLAG